MRFLLVISLIVVVSGCKKAEDRSCFKSTGPETTIVRDLSDFSGLFVGTNVNLVLVQDGSNEVRITGGKNLLNFISSEILEGVLYIRNENKCNFLRSYKHEITVEVHFTGLSYIEFEGTKPLICEVPISGNNLAVIIRDGAGLVDLDLNYNNVTLTVTNGWGNFDLSGNVGNLTMDIRNNGFGTTYDLNVSNAMDIISNTAGLLQLNTDGADCTIQLQSAGDVWYVGTPNSLNATQLGDGVLIDKN